MERSGRPEVGVGRAEASRGLCSRASPMAPERQGRTEARGCDVALALCSEATNIPTFADYPCQKIAVTVVLPIRKKA